MTELDFEVADEELTFCVEMTGNFDKITILNDSCYIVEVAILRAYDLLLELNSLFSQHLFSFATHRVTRAFRDGRILQP